MQNHVQQTELILVQAGSAQDPDATSDYYIAEEGTQIIPAY